jgi:exfoliative toxin A/B
MPSFSAFTFPFVISAIATGEAYKFFGLSILNYLFHIQAIIALVLVIFVFYNYLKFLIETD